MVRPPIPSSNPCSAVKFAWWHLCELKLCSHALSLCLTYLAGLSWTVVCKFCWTPYPAKISAHLTPYPLQREGQGDLKFRIRRKMQSLSLFPAQLLPPQEKRGRLSVTFQGPKWVHLECICEDLIGRLKHCSKMLGGREGKFQMCAVQKVRVHEKFCMHWIANYW